LQIMSTKFCEINLLGQDGGLFTAAGSEMSG